MPDDWNWMWASEAGRSRLLREEIEDLQGAATVARSQTARLSSQLASLQGSLASRLNALAAAFDAYVELGDVRERLDGYPDTSAIRRDAEAALQVLVRGGTPDRVDDRGLDYWLSYAMNAVIALAAGEPSEDAAARAIALDPQAELFLTAAAGVLGHGPAVPDRVPRLLTSDGPLTPAQLALWQAARAGTFGEVTAVLGDVWRPVLDQSAGCWVSWARELAGARAPVAVLRRLERLVSDPSGVQGLTGPVEASALVLAGDRAPTEVAAATPDAARTPGLADPRDGLRRVVEELVGQGMGEEVSLLARARLLRARIQDPTGVRAEGDEELLAAPEVTVTQILQAALTDPTTPAKLRRRIVAWAAPGLRAAAADLVTAEEQTTVELVRARTATGSVVVTRDGPDPGVPARIESALVETYERPVWRVALPGGIAAIGAVVAVVLGSTGRTGLAVLVALVAVGAGIGAFVGWRDRRAGQRSAIQARAASDKALADAQVQVRSMEAARAATVEESHQLAAVIDDRLGALAS